MFSLNSDSPVPLYRQLADRLETEIREGVYGERGRLPSEPQLARRLGITRPTVRQAFEQLRTRRLIERRQGAGTFVLPQRPGMDLFSLAGTLASFELQGLSTDTAFLQPLQVTLVDAREEFNPFAGQRAYHFCRVSRTESGPVLLERIYASLEIFPGLDAFSLTRRSLARICKEHYFLEPDGGVQTFQVSSLCGKEAQEMAVQPDSPLLLVRRTLDFGERKAAVFAEMYCRTDQLLFYQSLSAGA